VSKELDRSAAQVSEITLNHALRTALGASAARYDDEDVQDRLRARKDRSAAGGWGGGRRAGGLEMGACRGHAGLPQVLPLGHGHYSPSQL